MADQLKSRRTRDDDSLVPLLTLLIVVAAAGPALLTAVGEWLRVRAVAGGESVAFTLGGWWERNWWLAAFWAAELMVLLLFVSWSRRRRRRRQRQLDSVAAGLDRVMPADWDPARHVRVLRWRGHHPVRLRVQLTPRSRLDDPEWRESVAEEAARTLGPMAPVQWPAPPRGGVHDWGARPPRIELRVARRAPAESPDSVSQTQDLAPVRRLESLGPGDPDSERPYYRRPASAGRSATDLGSTSTRNASDVRED